MSNVSPISDALAGAIHLANEVRGRVGRRVQNYGIAVVPTQHGRVRLILVENRRGIIVQITRNIVRRENVARHVRRISKVLKTKARQNPYAQPIVFRDDVCWKPNFPRQWRSVSPITLSPRRIGDSVIEVPYHPA